MPKHKLYRSYALTNITVNEVHPIYKLCLYVAFWNLQNCHQILCCRAWRNVLNLHVVSIGRFGHSDVRARTEERRDEDSEPRSGRGGAHPVGADQGRAGGH